MTNEKKYFLQTLVIHGLMGFFYPAQYMGLNCFQIAIFIKPEMISLITPSPKHIITNKLQQVTEPVLTNG